MLDSKNFDACHLLGVILLQKKELAEALKFLDRAIEINFRDSNAQCNRALALFELKRFEEAVIGFGNAIKLKRDFAKAYVYRGNSLVELERFDEALLNYDKAALLIPSDAEFCYNRGKAFGKLKRFDDALACYEMAIALNPNFAEAYDNRGLVLQELDRFEEALADADRAIALKPDLTEAHHNRALALRESNQLSESLLSCDRAIALNAESEKSHLLRSMLFLLLGKFELGFQEFEWRKLKNAPRGTRQFDKPLWLGETPIQEKTILIHHEGGLGDTIQFSRYIKQLTDMNARVLFGPQPSLRQLFEGFFDYEMVDLDGLLPNFDFHCPMQSLPLAMKTTSNSIPHSVPYLAAEPIRVEKWGKRLGNEGFKVGICWQGSKNKVDVGRSFQLSQFEGISKIAGVRLISLHKGAGEEQLRNLPKGMEIETLGEDFDSGDQAFLDTAAVMKNCDLVITSDTSVAHLAGALAVPTWVALKLVPEWRWLLGRDDSPWYPTMRLFRQEVANDWPGAFKKIEVELSEKLASSSGVVVDDQKA